MSVLKDLYHGLLDSGPAQSSAALLRAMLPQPHIGTTRLDVAVPGLPTALDGLRILHISDLHLRPGSELAHELPTLAAATPHDLTLYTGDFIDNDDGIAPVTELLARMPRSMGAFAVLGNHDYLPLGRDHGRNDVPRLRAALHSVGVEVLMNAARPTCGGELFIVGVDDPATRHDNLAQALTTVPAGACSVLLTHSPDIVARLGSYQPNLILAGHTHGGQIRLPLIGPLLTMSALPRHLVMGLHQHNGITLFVSRGIGYSGLDLRLDCPAEIALVTLRSALAVERAA